MRITENQIRRIIRQVLTEARRARDWATYVAYTSEDHDIPREDVEKMVDDYKSIVAMLNSRLKDPKFQGKLDRNYTKHEMDFLKIEEGQGDSYQEFVDWYMRFNSSPARDTYSSTENQKWLHPQDVIDIIFKLSDAMDEPIDPIGDADPSEAEEPQTRVQRALEKAKQRREARKQKRGEKKDVRQQGREDREDIDAGIDEAIAQLDELFRAGKFPQYTREEYLDYRKDLQKSMKKSSRSIQRDIIKAIRAGDTEEVETLIKFRDM